LALVNVYSGSMTNESYRSRLWLKNDVIPVVTNPGIVIEPKLEKNDPICGELPYKSSLQIQTSAFGSDNKCRNR
jgi:hypothetical protein